MSNPAHAVPEPHPQTAAESAGTPVADPFTEEAALAMIVDLETRLAESKDLAHQLESANDDLARQLMEVTADATRLGAELASAQVAIVKVQTDADLAFTKALGDARQADRERLARLQLFNVDRTSGRTLVAAEGFNEALAIVLSRAPETADDRIRGIAMAGMGFLI